MMYDDGRSRLEDGPPCIDDVPARAPPPRPALWFTRSHPTRIEDDRAVGFERIEIGEKLERNMHFDGVQVQRTSL